MSKFRLISKNGDALALLYRISEEGNFVDFWIKERKAKPSYKGILPNVEHWSNGLTRDTIILFDMVGLGSIADKLKKTGFKVYGGSSLNDKLELDRPFGIKIAEMGGIKVPKFEKFRSFQRAVSFLEKSKEPWVFKPQDNKSPAFTYVSTDTEDMKEMLDYFKGIWKGKVDFILQEKIEGVEVSTEGFYIDGKLVPNTLNSTIEQKRFMNGDLGPNTGCMSSVVRFWKNPSPKIYRLTLQKIEPFLRRFKYTGPLDMNCIISGKDHLPRFLEFTARFGYNALYALCEGLEKVGVWVSGMTNGQPEPSSPSYDWLGAVRVSIPPYPLEVKAEAGKPVRGVDNLEHLWLLDVMYENGRLLTAGVDGVIGEVTGRAKTIEELGKQIYSRIDKLKIPDLQYRQDVFTQAQEKIDKLKEWKYF